MKIRIAKKTIDEVSYETIRNVQIAWIGLDKNDKENLMTNFMVKDNETEKIIVIPTDKITIM